MAPFAVSRGGTEAHYGPMHQKLHERQYNTDSDAGSAQSSSDLVDSGGGSPGSTAGLFPTVYVGIGVGVGSAILIAILVVIIQIFRKQREHRSAIAELEREQVAIVRQEEEISEVPRPAIVARCGSLMPLHAQAGWGVLSSDETLDQPQAVQHQKNKRSSISLPNKFRQRGVQLKKLKHLSAIMESPRSRSVASTSPATRQTMQYPSQQASTICKRSMNDQSMGRDSEEDVSVFHGSPKPEVLPSFAIRSPGMYGAAIANEDRPKPPRSVSVGALLGPIPEDAVFGQASRAPRPQMHARSFSLGAPPSRPPPGPVPPLPVIAPHAEGREESNRQRMCSPRLSSSSQGSANSSVLLTSPILVQKENKNVASPSLEEVVADDNNAQLKSVLNRQWQNPLITGPRPVTPRLDTSPMTRTSVRSNIARYSTDSSVSRMPSSASISSSADDGHHRLSIPQVGTADRVSISRVSSVNSLCSNRGIRKISTPRKPSKTTSVSANGSPAERKKSGALREISGNAVTPSRQASSATQDSGRSSNGNPFQWDQPLSKPSALKGSPNARKGHRRQNCVRISTLTPQVLGPPPSRPTSPSIMHGIEEESADGDESQNQPNGVRFVMNQRLSRPPSTSSLALNLRVQTLRASLTPSSPTLSARTEFQEHGLPSQNSDSQLSVSPATRTASRQSDRSSAFSIPKFPSPIKATVSGIQHGQPIPQFCISRPSTDSPREHSSSPPVMQFSSDNQMPSSPPLPVSKEQEYDPAWPMICVPAPEQSKEYDPASPTWDVTEPERSSPFFAFATTNNGKETSEYVSPRSLAFAKMKAGANEDGLLSPCSRPTSYGVAMPDTPPCSPKTMPEGFHAFFDKRDTGAEPPRAAEKLTSANASALMASMPGVVDFPGAPILSPPLDPETQSTQVPTRSRQRAVSNVTNVVPLRPPPPPSMPSSDTCIPSPLHFKSNASPQGPRSEPAKSVLNNVMALRRMNSEIDQTRADRRYVRLGREASPLLPFIGSPDPSESYNDLFDFGFETDAHAGAEEAAQPSALDDIDMSDLDRRLDGALAGFDAELGSDTVMNRASRVWDVGEKFWEERTEAELEPRSHIPVSLTSVKDGLNGLAMPEGILKVPAPEMAPQPPSSISKTPRSLYDSNGFLRS